MNDNNSVDWLAVQMQAPDKGFADMYSQGIAPDNVSLQDKQFYQSSPKIQAKFKQANGQFDKAAFDDYYLNAQKSMNQYKASNFDIGNVTTNLWEDTSVARALNAPIRKSPVKVSLAADDPFTNLKNAEGSFFGLTQINKWTSPTKSIAEVAQSQKVLDGATGKELDYTPNDTGISNLYGFLNEPLVLSSYDQDVKDPYGKIIHKRGEMKLDEKGLPRYETLAGRDPSGREKLSRWDTLTTDGSFFNKFDFMDSDGLDKSITGTIVKGAAETGMLFLGGEVGAAYKAFYIASGLVDGLAQIAKSIDGIATNSNDDSLYKFANTLQGYTANFKTGMSEKGKSSMFSVENLANQVVDALFMMKSQNTVAQWPSEVKKYQLARELGLVEGNAAKAITMTGEKSAELGGKLLDIASYETRYGKDFEAAAKALQGNYEMLEKYGKYSHYMSTAYMAATMAPSISEIAEKQGIDPRDQGFLYLGYASALMPFFNAGMAKWVEGRLDVDELANGVSAATKDWAEQSLPKVVEDAAAKTAANTTAGRAAKYMLSGREMGKAIVDKFKNFTVHNLATAALAGGTEMASLELLKTGIEKIYNSLSSAGYTSSLDTKQFDLNADEVLREVGSAAFGGAFGGAIFKLADRQKHDVFKSSNMMEYVVNGYGSKVVDKIKDLQEKGQLGSKTLSMQPLVDSNGNNIPNMWKPVNTEAPISQNDFIADNMIKQVRVQEALVKAANILNPNMTAEQKNQYFAGIVDTKSDTDLRDRIVQATNKIFDLGLEIGKIPDDDENKEGLLAKKTDLRLAKTELEYLQSDESLDEFFRQGLFNIRTDIHAPFGVQTRNSMAKELNPDIKSFDGLTPEQKVTVERQYNEYKNNDGANGLKADLYKARLSYDRFNTNMERNGHYGRLDMFRDSLEQLKEYAGIYEPEPYKDEEGKIISTLPSYELANEYIQQLKGVKYIPDFMYDKIKKKLTTFQSDEAYKYLRILAANPDSLLDSISNNIDSINLTINDPFVREYIAKKIGDKEMKELFESPEFDDLSNNKESASHYSLLHVLNRLSQHTDDAKVEEYRRNLDQVIAMDDDRVSDVLSYLSDPENNELEHSQELTKYLEKLKLPEFVKTIGEDAYEDLQYQIADAKDTLKNLMQLAHMKDASKADIDPSDAYSLMLDPHFNDNFILGLLSQGRYTSLGNVLYTDSIRHTNIDQLENNVQQAKAFDATRVKSPLADWLKETYEFAKEELKTLEEVGYTNYLNRSESFQATLKEHMAAVKRVAALVESAATLNPLVNDFRKVHSSTLETTKKGLELFVMSPDDSSYLDSELGHLYTKLQHLERINTYNKNNTLARLLREDGLDVANKYSILKDIASKEDVATLLPSLGSLFENKELGDYSQAPRTSSDDLKKKAIYQIAKFEHNVFMDFQKLNESDKSLIANKTFKPIDVDTREFYDSGSTETAYNPYAATIYLARTFGASSIDFYTKFAGDFNTETELFENLEKAKYVPFPNQENAVRMGHFMKYGDRSVIKKLFNAYATEWNEKGDYDFDVPTQQSVVTYSTSSIWGDPGVGKTTAAFNNIVNLMPKGGVGDILLLAPKQRQVDGLRGIVEDAGFEDRVDKANSRIFRDFLKSMGLRNKKDDSQYDVTKHDAMIDYKGMNEGQLKDKFREQLEHQDHGVIKKLDIYKDSNDDGYTLNDSLVRALSKYHLIAVDEYTHVNPMDLALLIKLVDLYNGSNAVKGSAEKRIIIQTLGDPHQLGYIGADGVRRTYTDINKLIISSPLTTSLRSGWDVVNNTQRDLIDRAVKYTHMNNAELAKSETLAESKDTPVKLNYVESKDENGNLGIKMINKTGNLEVNDLSFITDNKHLLTGKDVLYVVKDEDSVPVAQALLQEALGENWNNFVDIYTPNEVQGGERKYAIIDAGAELKGETGDSRYDIRRSYQFLNTMLSRATEATLFVNDGRYDKFITFQNDKQNKAIRQIKLDDNIKKEIKSNKQKLMKMILQTEGESVPDKPATTPTEEMKDTQVIPVSRIATVEPIFAPQTTEKMFTSSKEGDIISYNSYMSTVDQDNIFKLRFPTLTISEVNDPARQAEVSKIVNSYKYYLLHRDLLGDRQVALRSNFKELFDNANLKWETPEFFFEAGKRGKEGANVGRTELGDGQPRNDDELTFALKVKLPYISEQGIRVPEKDLDITMGYMNNLDALTAKGSKHKDVDTFMKQLKGYVNTGKGAPEHGEGSNSGPEQWKWKSTPLPNSSFVKYSEIFGSRMHWSNSAKMGYKDFVDNYFDFYITAPQVVVANMIDNNNKSILDPSNKNGEYRDYWTQLKGKAVAFASEVYELRNSLTAKDMLDTYIKQLGYFGTEGEYNDGTTTHVWADQLSNEDREAYIQGIPERIPVGSSGATIPYRPNLIKLIKLDNPTMPFLGFREKFLDVVTRKQLGLKMTPDQLNQFNTSIYVKDRLAKSLVTLKKFLDSKEGLTHFESEILPKQHATANALVDYIEGQYKDYDAKLSDLMMSEMGPMTSKQFREQLNSLLDPNGDESIFRGTYPTVTDKLTGEATSRKVYKANLTAGVTSADLNISLSGDKQADFAGSLIDLKLFNLFKKTRNANFAQLIDLSLRALGNFDKLQKFKNYDLSSVFKDGQIETVIIPQADNATDHVTNVLAEAIQYGNDFSLNLDKLTHPSYNIHFDQILQHWKGELKEEPQYVDQVEEVADSITDYIDGFRELKGTDVYREHMSDSTKYETLDELKDALSDLGAHVEVPTKGDIHLNTATHKVIDVASGTVTGDVDVQSHINDKLTTLLGNDSVVGAKFQEIDSTPNSLSVRVQTVGGDTYELKYDNDTKQVSVVPIQITNPETSPMDVLKKLEQDELADYDKKVETLFGDTATDPAARSMLDLFRQDFRHTVATRNIASMQTEKPFTLKEYDAELAMFNPTESSEQRSTLMAENPTALRPHARNLSAMSRYIDDYTPKLC